LQTGDCPTDDSIETDLELCFEPLVQSGYWMEDVFLINKF
jgi:hypothetical protein